MDDKNSSSISHKFSTIPITFEGLHDEINTPLETILESVVLRNPNSPLNRITSSTQNDMLISTYHPPTTILNSHPLGETNKPNALTTIANAVVRQQRARGRPKGSKNKRKASTGPLMGASMPPPQPQPYFKCHSLEIPPNSDVMERVNQFVRTQDFGVAFLAATGYVQNVFFRKHVALESPSYQIGTFQLVSMQGIYMGSNSLTNKSETGERSYSYYDWSQNNYMSIVVKGPEGNTFGGVLSGRLITASKVVITMLPISNPEFHKSHEVLDHQNQHPYNGGGCSSSKGGPSPRSSSEAIGFVGEEYKWDPNPKDKKLIRFSEF